ncbi:MAG: SLC13 family permease [Planctomycetota bacterium]
MPSTQTICRIVGPTIALLVYWACRGGIGLDHSASMTAAVTAWCAVWWCTEAVPIPVTSLIPFAVFPFAGVLDHAQLASTWGDKFILLFMGGFMISRAAEHSNTHLRVAHGVLRLVGMRSNRRIIIGFMLATAFCSMWISNTATALIMLPVAIAVIQQNAARGAEGDRFAVGLLLAIAYGASIGGVATLVGTPPNGVMAAVYESEFGRTIDFLSWMKVGMPVAVLMLIACGVLLTVRVKGAGQQTDGSLGPWTPAQRRMLTVLIITAALWITRKLPGGLGGWSVWLDMPKAHDATVALLVVVALFLIPSGERDHGGRRRQLLDWKTACDIPWGILILFAGGLAIAKAFAVSGLAADVGDGLQRVTDGLHPILIIGLICLLVTFVTEVTSNTATTALLMPILATAGMTAGIDSALFMVPAALSASCAFMLPIATPPNAIVFGGSNQITIPKMVRYGVILNLIGAVVITLVCYAVLSPETGLGGSALPMAEQLSQP